MRDRTRLILSLLLGLIAISIASGAELAREVLASDVLAKIKAGQPAEFDKCVIVGSLDLSALKIGEQVHFNNTRFQGSANFEGTIFKRTAYFKNATFSNVFFVDATFCEDARFIDATFLTPNFEGVTFSRDAIFSGAKFNGAANFEGAMFCGIAYFQNVMFSGDAYFKYVTFSDLAYFFNAMSSGYTNFTVATISKEIYFNDATFSEGASFEGAMFRGNAISYGVTFGGYFYGWDDIKNALACDEATYLKLIKNFKDHGQSYEANDCYYIYKFYYMNAPSDYLAWITCGFGVKWLQTIYFGIFMILLFGLVYFIIIVTRSSLSETAATGPRSMQQQLLDTIWFSAMVLLSVPSELCPKKASIYKEYTNVIKYHLPILERLIGWGILILFINTLSRTMLYS